MDAADACETGCPQTVANGTCTACSDKDTCTAATCDAGFVFNATSPVSCEPCVPGTFQDQTNTDRSTCSFCAAGTEFTSASTACRPCDSGTYQNQNNQPSVQCKFCPAGSVYNSDFTAGGAANGFRPVDTAALVSGRDACLAQNSTGVCPVFENYAASTDRACLGRNEVCGASELPCSGLTTFDTCKTSCTNNPACISFEFAAGPSECQQSTSCKQNRSRIDAGWTLYVITTTNPYTEYIGNNCAARNEICGGSAEPCDSVSSNHDCKMACDADPTCVSYEFKASSGSCQLSTTCTPDVWTTNTDGWNLYVKEPNNTANNNVKHIWNNWDVGNVQDMAGLFDGQGSFNQAISRWNVTSVTTMERSECSVPRTAVTDVFSSYLTMHSPSPYNTPAAVRSVS